MDVYMNLPLPDEYRTYKMVAIDPGLNFTGIAIYTLDIYNRIVDIDAYTIITDKLRDTCNLDGEFFPDRAIKLEKLYIEISGILAYTNPYILVYENPFINHRRPMAYGALLEVVSAIKRSVLDYNPNILMLGIEPLLVKKTVGASLSSIKLDVRDAIFRIPEIYDNIRINFNHLDEHSIDAIAVGYSFLRTTLTEG